MAIVSSYATLQTAVSDYLARSDLTSFVPNFIQNCENKLYRTLNLRNEETALSVNISSGVAAVPSDFKALKFAYYNSAPTRLLEWVSVDEIYRKYPVRSDSTTPYLISREGSNFVFGPVATDLTAGLKGIYYAKKDPLRTTDPSWYVTNAPELLLYGSLLEAEPFIRNDPRIMVWRELYNEAVQTIREEENMSKKQTGPLIARVGFAP